VSGFPADRRFTQGHVVCFSKEALSHVVTRTVFSRVTESLGSHGLGSNVTVGFAPPRSV